jgi:hypothetical protein
MKGRKNNTPTVSFCDRCASVCDARSRENTVRARAERAVLRHGFRI